MVEFVVRYQLLVAAVLFAILFLCGRVLTDYALLRYRSYLLKRDRAFRAGYIEGRAWLAGFIAEAEYTMDHRDSDLRFKKHPARKSADIVADVKREKRALTARVKALEYQLKSYEEYFPMLEDYRDDILNEEAQLTAGGDGVEALEALDPVRKFLSRHEWEKLSPSKRNQRALDVYVSRSKANWEIGRAYERYLGYLRERDGWSVTYQGALSGFEDLGRDLICERDGQTEIVQAKYWRKQKLIREKHVFQLLGTTMHFRLGNPGKTVTPVLVTTTELSDVARLAASLLEVRVEQLPFSWEYPMIKCNINRSTGERIYHLPFDQMYDRTVIRNPGETYVRTVAEAEKRGFRRAWRHHVAGAAS